MRDIVVTTPKSQIAHAADEAQHAKEMSRQGRRTWYFRKVGQHLPNHIDAGSRVYYVEDGHIYGFGVANHYFWSEGIRDELTGELFGGGFYLYIWADSWQWIEPIAHKGFQGWRYAPDEWRDIEIIGDWLDPKPADETRSA